MRTTNSFSKIEAKKKFTDKRTFKPNDKHHGKLNGEQKGKHTQKKGDSGSQIGTRPAALLSSGNALQVQTFRPHPRSTESETAPLRTTALTLKKNMRDTCIE